MSRPWSQDFSESRAAEFALKAYLQSKYEDVQHAPDDEALPWDLKVESIGLVIEVKVDRYAGVKSNNVAIEVGYRGKPSGLTSTQATHWVIFVGGIAHAISVADLRALLPGCKRVMGGDMKSAELVLVPLQRFCSKAYRYPPFAEAA